MSLFIRENLLQYHREYYQRNRTKHIENVKEYRLENKEKINELYKKMYTCPICQKEVQYYWRKKHFGSNHHRNRVMLKIFFKKWRTF